MIIFLGAPGSGKGTQSKKLVLEKNFVQISTGDLLREAIKNGTSLGVQAKGFMDKGELVPDALVVGLIEEQIHSKPDFDQFIFDGFPRTLVQAKNLDGLLKKVGKSLKKVFYFRVEDKELIYRLSLRRVCKGCGATFHLEKIPPKKDGVCDVCASGLVQRTDDEEKAIKMRLEQYRVQTVPLIDFYRDQGLLKEIDALGDPALVFETILNSF